MEKLYETNEALKRARNEAVLQGRVLRARVQRLEQLLKRAGIDAGNGNAETENEREQKKERPKSAKKGREDTKNTAAIVKSAKADDIDATNNTTPQDAPKNTAADTSKSSNNNIMVTNLERKLDAALLECDELREELAELRETHTTERLARFAAEAEVTRLTARLASLEGNDAKSEVKSDGALSVPSISTLLCE